MNQKFLIGLTLLVTLSCVNGHGRLMQPASRGSAWRIFPDKFPNTIQDDSRFCFQNDAMGFFFNGNATCGICGPITMEMSLQVLESQFQLGNTIKFITVLKRAVNITQEKL